MAGPNAMGAAPHELLDDGFAPEPCDLLVIGCGNILRGDDAVGPVLVRHLFERGVPAGCRLVDGGTAGMDVAFGMRGAARVVIVDAAATGAEPGTVYRVPAEELAELPPIDGLHTHNFRWDHALSFSSWLLGPERPRDVTVYLVEAASLEPGAPLTPAVEAGMRRVIGLIEADHLPGGSREGVGVEGRDGDRGADRGGRRARPVDGLPAGDQPERGGAAPAGDAPHRGPGAAGRGRRTTDGGATPGTAGGPR
ncbi:hydrogenase maturation protease [Nocardioides sp. YIM 152588]|uniref:hydrogenase maturation protease n=1 Tax=Nocardioides sp. YIM 152588 TaxID=3158259 RepID=UPI0032E443F8